MRRLLVTLPAHNEADRLYESVHRVHDQLRQSGRDFVLSIAEDGSTDGTGAVIERLQREFPTLVVQRDAVKIGRGLALRRLWSSVDAEAYVFIDADLPSDPAAIESVVRAVESGADVATGSRYCPGAEVHRPPLRSLVSLVYNSLVRFLFHESIRDHQCGLKAFKKEALVPLLAASHEDSWTWDTEILVLAVWAGLTVVEVPIEWTELRFHRTPFRRTLADIQLHGSALLRLRDELGTRVRKPARAPHGLPSGSLPRTPLAESIARMPESRTPSPPSG